MSAPRANHEPQRVLRPTHVRIHIEEGGWLLPLPACALGKALQAMLAITGEQGRCVALHVVRDGRMAEENAALMGCSGPTNILSFPGEPSPGLLMPHLPPGGEEALPDILLLSVDTLRRECVLYGQEECRHALRLLAHGMGHVLGYDHGAAMDAVCARMWAAGGSACGIELASENY